MVSVLLIWYLLNGLLLVYIRQWPSGWKGVAFREVRSSRTSISKACNILQENYGFYDIWKINKLKNERPHSSVYKKNPHTHENTQTQCAYHFFDRFDKFPALQCMSKASQSNAKVMSCKYKNHLLLQLKPPYSPSCPTNQVWPGLVQNQWCWCRVLCC